MYRQHKSNGILLIIDSRQRRFWQKCHDPDCRSYRSVTFNLPPALCCTPDVLTDAAAAADADAAAAAAADAADAAAAADDAAAAAAHEVLQRVERQQVGRGDRENDSPQVQQLQQQAAAAAAAAAAEEAAEAEGEWPLTDSWGCSELSLLYKRRSIKKYCSRRY